MKFPKLLYVIGIVFIYTNSLPSLLAQVNPSLNSSKGNGPTIELCRGESISFSISGGVQFSFSRIRGGITTVVRAKSASNLFSSNDFENGDIIFGSAWDADDNPLSNTNTISLEVHGLPSPGFFSDTIGNTFCEGDEVLFTASGGTTYSFFLNGIEIQAQSSQHTLSLNAIPDNAEVRVRVFNSENCSIDFPMNMIENSLTEGSIGGNQTICNGNTPNTLTSITPGTIEGVNAVDGQYQWQSSIDGVNWNPIVGAENSSFTPGSLIQTTFFRRIVTNQLNGKVCEVVSNSIQVEVLDVLVGGDIVEADVITCADIPFGTLTVVGASAGAHIQFQWEQSINGAAFTDIIGATGASLTPSGISSTTRFRRRTFSLVGEGCDAMSDVFTAILNDISPGELDNNQSTTLCFGDQPDELSNGAGGTDPRSQVGTITYQWENSINGADWNIIPGAENAQFQPPTLTQTTHYRRRAISTFSGSTCSSATNAIVISILDNVNAGSIQDDQTICDGELPANLILTGMDSGAGISYQWQSSNDNITFNDVPDTDTEFNFTMANAPTQTTYYRVVVTNSAGPGCSAISSVASVTVLDNPPAPSFFSDAPGNTFCEDEAVLFTASGGDFYTFFLNGTEVQAESNLSTVSLSSIPDHSIVRVEVKNANSCSVSLSLNMIENSLTAGTIGGDQVICNGDQPAEFSSFSPGIIEGVDAVNGQYQWESSTDGINWNPIVGATNAQLTPAGLLQTTLFRRLVTNELNGKSCEIASNEITVSVLDVLVGGDIPQADQIICIDDGLPTLTVDGASSGPHIQFQWEQSVNNGPFTTIVGATGASFTPSELNSSTRFRRMTYSNQGDGCSVKSTIFSAVLNDIDPGALDPSQAQQICFGTTPTQLSNGALGQDATSSVGSISYQWQNSTNALDWNDIVGEENAQFQPPALTQTTFYRRLATSSFSGSTCSSITNFITITVLAEIQTGTILDDQTICLGEVPANLELSGMDTGAGISYQWQFSTDNITFNNFPDTDTVLNFTEANAPTLTTFYRMLVENSTAPGCSALSQTISITVIQTPTITQTQGPVNQQEVCPGDAIIPVTFEFGGDATDLIFPDLHPSLTAAVGPGPNEYTISGNPTADAITFSVVTVNPSACVTVSTEYQILRTLNSTAPTQITHSLSLCEEDFPTNTSFFVTRFAEVDPVFTALEWDISPDAAGVINYPLSNPGGHVFGSDRQAIVDWNADFNGTATVAVRSIGCGGNSAWLNFAVEVIPETSPPTLATVLTEPSVFLDVDFGLGPEPECRITAETMNTQYTATTAAGPINFASIQWTIENVIPGGGETNPGSISANGLVDWNPDFFGQLQIVAQPVSCNGTLGPKTVHNVSITDADEAQPNIFVGVGSDLPNCPAPAGHTTDFDSDEAVTWSIDNADAGTINPATGILTWSTGFSGFVTITASKTFTCATNPASLRVYIPPANAYTLLSPVGTLNQTVCQDSPIDAIEYSLSDGFATFAAIDDLPAGLTANFEFTLAQARVTLTGNTLAAGESYTLRVQGSLPFGTRSYTFTSIAGGTTAAAIASNLIDQINDDGLSMVNVDDLGGGIFQLTSKAMWHDFTLGTALGPGPNGITLDTDQLEVTQRLITITGSPTVSTGVYVYTLRSTGGLGGCTQTETTGRIEVIGKPQIDLVVGTAQQDVCDVSTIVSLTYQLTNSNDAEVVDLPNGVHWRLEGNQVIISGTPTTLVTQTTHFDFTVRTVDTPCEPEAEVQGRITVHPEHTIELSSAPLTDQQTICENTAITTISYQLGGAATGFSQTGLPAGIITDFDPMGRILHLTGVPTVPVSVTTHYDYQIETTGVDCVSTTITGRISVEPPPILTLTSAASTTNQVGFDASCRVTNIAPISYQLNGNAVAAVVNGLPEGVIGVLDGNEFTISGAPSQVHTTTVVYTYIVSSTGSACQPEVSTTGIIEVTADQLIELISAPETDQQQVCENVPIVPIQYEMLGSTTNVTIDNLPPGITSDVNTGTGIISLSGTPTLNVSNPTSFVYEITTVGTNCTASRYTGEITILPLPRLSLTSSADSANQTGINGVCSENNIVSITYRFDEGATAAEAVGLPPGIQQSSEGNLLTIFGTIATHSTTTLYNYTVRTTGSICIPEVELNGTIEVFPLEELQLISSAETTNQLICENTSILPIQYQLLGSTTDVTISNLPPGITSNINTGTGVLSITGTATLDVATRTQFIYEITTVGPNCDATTYQGEINVYPLPRLTLTSGADSANQTELNGVCSENNIVSITYRFDEGATAAEAVGLPPGIQQSSEGNLLTIFGTISPHSNITQYNYTVRTIGSICAQEAELDGTIEVFPAQALQLNSPAETVNQTLCEGGTIAPIRYLMAGSTSSVFTDLPPGIISSLNNATKELTITGTPTEDVTENTTYVYTITSVGTMCTSIQVSGTIVLQPLPRLNLISEPSTTDQTGVNGICSSEAIVPIVYEFGEGALTANIEDLPPGIVSSIEGNRLTISGTPDTPDLATTFTYRIQTSGSACGQEVGLSGQIEVIPAPIIHADYIREHDITQIGCSGGADGAIRIPVDSPDYDLRIGAGSGARAQIDEIQFGGTPVLGDEYTLSFNDIEVEHIVVASEFMGPTQTVTEVVSLLMDKINDTAALDALLVASASSTNVLRIVAVVPGVGFTSSGTILTTAAGDSPTVNVINRSFNETGDFRYLWSGPDGFTSTNLSIENLAAGTYTLRVSQDNCFSEASFEITEPQPIEITPLLCNGAFQATISGGIGPTYELKLYDHDDLLLRTDFSSGVFNYTGLTPGANYRLEATDLTCAFSTQIAIEMPFNLTYEANNTIIVNDYCHQTPTNTGEGSIALRTVENGNAFSGGSNNFNYQWSGPNNFTSITRDITGLIPGVYNVVVTDNILGCTATQTFELFGSTPLAITLAPDITLNDQNQIELQCAVDAETAIAVNVSGGSSVYNYAWYKNDVLIGGATNPSISNLEQAKYTVVVTDVPPGGIDPNNICQLTQSFEVIAPDSLEISIDEHQFENISCQSETIDIPVLIRGGTPPFTVQLNDDLVTIATSSRTFTINNISPGATNGQLILSIEDANACQSSSSSVSLNIPQTINFSHELTHINCDSDQAGSIQLAASPSISASQTLVVEWRGEDFGFFDSWANGQGALNEIQNPGTYTVSVTTPQGCLLYTTSVLIEDQAQPPFDINIASIDFPSSCSAQDGKITLEISGGFPPYFIEWERNLEGNEWTTLPALNNSSIAASLEEGVYRVMVTDSAQATDSSRCREDYVSSPIEIKAEKIAFNQFAFVTNDLQCVYGDDAVLQFSLSSTDVDGNQNENTAYQFYLNGAELSLSSNEFSFDENTQIYSLSISEQGSNLLTVESTSNPEGCRLERSFAVEFVNPIVYSGERDFQMSVCDTSYALTISMDDIHGGNPLIVENQPLYDLSWNYTSLTQEQQQFIGNVIPNAQPGTYDLTITDQNGCQNLEESITIRLTGPQFEPFTVTGILVDPQNGELVKSLANTCESDSDNGAIGVNITGGQGPFQIRWWRQDPSLISTNSQEDSYVLLPEYNNTNHLQNLPSGNYKIIIETLGEPCEIDTPFVYYEEVIEVTPNPEIQIISGPFVDENLCVLQPGRISLEVFNNNQGELSFYYNDVLLQQDANEIREGVYTLIVNEPSAVSTLKIVNEQGCYVTRSIDLSIGEPSFTYTSPTYAISQNILAREEITFENTSTSPYIQSEWLFGDNSTPLLVDVLSNPEPIRYSYPISGTYNVTLRLYNANGCFVEYTSPISVGRGYNIQVPNAFTPNNDLINDLFRPLTSGFGQIVFSVYDSYGNLLYSETREENDYSNPQGLEIRGWNGENQNQSQYYIYLIEGLLLDGVTEIEKRGSFILIR